MNTDLIMMIANLSNSFLSIQKLITGFAYFMGIVLILKSLIEFNKVMNSTGKSKYLPMMYLIVGGCFLFFPSVMSVLRTTVFGYGNNPLQFGQYNPKSVFVSTSIIVETFGGILFIKGCFLLMRPPSEESKHALKGMFYIFSSILAINFNNTTSYVSWLVQKLISVTMNN